MENYKFYVYAHFTRENTEVPFYIGKGSGNRCNSHSNRSIEWKTFVEKNGLVVKILYDNLTETEAFTKEIELIKVYGRKDLKEGQLLNKTNGGDGKENNYVPPWLVEQIKKLMFIEAVKYHNMMRF